MSLLWRKRLYYCLLPVLIAITLATASFKTGISAFFIAGDNAQEILLASEMQSGSLSRRYILSLAYTDKNQAMSSATVAAIIDQFKAIQGVSDVWQPGQQRFAEQLLERIYGLHAAHLYSLNPAVELEQIFSAAGLSQQAAILKSALMSVQGQMVKKIALHDPLLLTLNGFKGLAGQMQTWQKTNARYKNLLLETKMAGLDYARQVDIQQQLKAVVAQFNQTHSHSMSLDMTGVPVFAVATQTLIEDDVKKVTVLSCLALTLLFLVLFRSLNALLQVFLLLLTVVSSSVLLTTLIFGSIHGMTLAIGTTLVGICIDYPIHAIVHANTQHSQQRLALVAKIWPSMVLGGITTLIGYMALGFSGYPGFQQIAVYAACGILVSLVITRFILPAMVTLKTGRKVVVPGVKQWLFFCQRFRVFLWVGLLILFAGAVLGLESLHWLDDLEQLTPELQQLKSNDKRIRSRMLSSIEPGRFILVSDKNTELALQKAESVYQVLEQLKSQGDLADYFGLYPWVLSQKQQQQNALLLQQQLTAQNKSRWLTALSGQGLSVDRLALPDYADTPPLTVDTVLNSPLKRILENQIIIDAKQTLILIWIADHQAQQLRQIFADMDGVRYFSQRDMVNQMAADYRDQAKFMLLLGLGFIVLLLFLRYKNIIITLQTLLPAMLAALFMLSGWSISGQSISFLHLVGFLLAVAICVDYGIFYKENRAQDALLTYQAMAASMLTSALVFGCLAIADTSALRTLGEVVAIGVVLGFLFCPIIIQQKVSK